MHSDGLYAVGTEVGTVECWDPREKKLIGVSCRAPLGPALPGLGQRVASGQTPIMASGGMVLHLAASDRRWAPDT